MNHNVPVKQCIRVLEFIKSAGSVSFQSFSDGSTDKTILNSIQSASQKILCQTFLIDGLRKRDLIGVKGNTLVLSDAGVSWLKRNTGPKTVDKQERFQNQHRLLETQTTRVNGQQQTVQINGNESPCCLVGPMAKTDRLMQQVPSLTRMFTDAHSNLS